VPATFTNVVSDVHTLIDTGTSATITVVKRKFLEVLEPDRDRLPLIIVYPVTQALKDEGFEGKLVREYRVGVACLWAGNLTMESGLDNMLALLNLVPHLLNVTTLATATTVYDSVVDDSPAYDRDAIPKLYDHSVVEVAYLSSETRT
jgi:hypothetical protein